MLEKKYNLSSQKVCGLPFWQMARMKVYYALAQQLNIFGEPHPYKKGLKWKLIFLVGILYEGVKNIFKLVSLFRAEEIVFEHTRTKKINNDQLVDIYSYYYVQEKRMQGRKLIVFSKTQTGFIVKRDGLQRISIDSFELLRVMCGLVTLKLGLCRTELTQEISQYFQKSFEDVTPHSIECLLQKSGIEYFVSYCLYRAVFFIAFNVKQLVLVDGYSSRAGLIAAAKDSGLKVIELQHGVITRYHMGYSYPNINVESRFLPDDLLIWSGLWERELQGVWPANVGHYPNQYLESMKENYSHIEKQKNTIVVISQGAISTQLSSEILKNIDKFSRFSVYYKLHPSEYDSWQNSPSLIELSHEDNFKICTNTDLYELFSLCEYQVGVFSTALFEGGKFDCKLILVDLPGVEYMENIEDKKYLHELDEIVF